MKVLKIIGIVILTITVLVLLFIATIFFSYFFTKKNITKYIPNNFDTIVKIESVSNLYANIIDVKAIDLILEEVKMGQFIKTLNEVRQIKILRNPIVKFLADIPVYVVLKNNKPYIVTDLKFLSPLVNLVSLDKIEKKIFSKKKKTTILSTLKNKLFILTL